MYDTLGIAVYNHQISNNNTISQNKEFKIHLISTAFVENIKNITFIKSEINNNRDLAIVWWNFKGNNQTRYYIYNMTEEKVKDYIFSSKMPNTCINKEYGTRINSFPTKDQISFSCVIKDENVQVLFYNKTNFLKSTNVPYLLEASCENKNGLSKLYFNDNKNYYIYSCFKNCSDKSYENDTYCLNIEKEKRNKMIILIVIIIVIIIALLIALFIIFRKYKQKTKLQRDWEKGQKDDKLMNDIMTDLLPNN